VVLATGGPAWAATVTPVQVAPTGFFGGLFDLDAVSASDGWAVGGNGNGMVQRFNVRGRATDSRPRTVED
jgi:hypothetical protein